MLVTMYTTPGLAKKADATTAITMAMQSITIAPSEPPPMYFPPHAAQVFGFALPAVRTAKRGSGEVQCGQWYM